MVNIVVPRAPVTNGDLTTTGTTGIIGMPARSTEAAPLTSPQPAQATTTTLTPTKLGDPSTWTTTPDQTVAGQITNLTDPNSPLIAQARARATQQANARGLMNSSMAMTGADAAAYDAAMPIAQADAAQASKVAGYNVDTANQFKVRDADTATQVGLANMGAMNQTSQFNTGQSNQFLSQERQQGFDLTKMDRAAAIALSQMSAEQQNNLARMAAAQGYNLETMSAQQINELARMTTAQGFDLAKMDKAAAQTLAQMSAQQQNDLAKLAQQQGYNLQTMSAQQINDLAKMATGQQYSLQTLSAQQQNTLAQMAAQQGLDLAKMDKQAALTLSQMSAQQANDMAQLAARQGYTLQTMNAEQANTLAKMAVEIEAADKAAEQKFGFDKQLLDIQKAATRDIATIEAQYKNLTQASASAASIVNGVAANVAKIMENTTMDAAAKQKAIDIYNANANKALQMMGAISGDPDLVEFFAEVLG